MVDTNTKDAEKKKALKILGSKLTLREGYWLSWSVFDAQQSMKTRLEEMSCKKCYLKHRDNFDKQRYNKKLKELKMQYAQICKLNEKLHPFHSLDADLEGFDFSLK